MKPKFKNILAWEQAQVLMQPAFIRVLDNLRGQLENSLWRGTYREVETPYPGYILDLTYDDRSFSVDLWYLCFQVCFVDYSLTDPDDTVDIDTELLDGTGEVDWQKLETKTHGVIQRLFADLPASVTE